MRVRRSSMLLVLSFVALIMPSCHAKSPLTPGGLEGDWAGRIEDDVWGSGTATLSLTPLPVGVKGQWTFVFETTAPLSGSLNGNLAGAAVTLVMSTSTPLSCGSAGSIGVAGTLQGNRITGTYIRFTCEGAEGGSVDLARAD